jgi:hypothetical protein
VFLEAAYFHLDMNTQTQVVGMMSQHIPQMMTGYFMSLPWTNHTGKYYHLCYVYLFGWSFFYDFNYSKLICYWSLICTLIFSKIHNRFPTLNRWIQMQANLHHLSDSPTTLKRLTEADQQKDEKRIAVKRPRESEHDAESDEDDEVHGILGMPVAKSVFDMDSKNSHTCSAISEDVLETGNFNADKTHSLLFDWENEGPYEEAVERCISCFGFSCHS